MPDSPPATQRTLPSLRSALRPFVFGLIMGGADIIPGVSGGTMALILGIYERLIGAISHLFRFAVSLARFDTATARDHWSRVEWTLVLPLGVGIGTALIVGARVIPYLLETYPAQMLGLFLGLVAASLIIPWQRIETVRLYHIAVVLAAAVLAFQLTGLQSSGPATPSLLGVFCSAAVAICAMILPGVSGAFLLKVMGIYEPTLEAINTVDLAYIVTFGAGAAIGLGLFSVVLNWLLNHYHDLTMAALVGLILGALRALWPYTSPTGVLEWPGPDDPVVSVVILCLLGFTFVLALTWWSTRLADPEAESTA